MQPTCPQLAQAIYCTIFDKRTYDILRPKLLISFEQGELHIPIEDPNCLVTTHLKYYIRQREPTWILEDLYSFLNTGFTSLDDT